MFIDRVMGIPSPLARARVGAAYLDEAMRGWHNKIDTDKLDLRCPDNCIIGQLHGNYWKFIERKDETFKKKVESRGIFSPYNWGLLCDLDHWQLTKAWRQIIEERRRQPVTARNRRFVFT